MDVAVRELKAKLSAYLERAAAGEMITVTDRGRPMPRSGRSSASISPRLWPRSG